MFCEVKGLERDGFGKLVRAGAECLVEYVDSPAEGGLEIIKVPKQGFWIANLRGVFQHNRSVADVSDTSRDFSTWQHAMLTPASPNGQAQSLRSVILAPLVAAMHTNIVQI